MTVTRQGWNKMAGRSASTWISCKIGTGTATVASGDVDLGASVLIKDITAKVVAQNKVAFDTYFGPGDANGAATTISEIAIFDASTNGNMLFRTVASTNTFTAFTKDAARAVVISVILAFSS